jgi:hypothetical protein
MNTLFKLIKDSLIKSKFTPAKFPKLLISPIQNLKRIADLKLKREKQLFKPTLYLSHPLSQVIYNIAERKEKVNY